MILPYTTIHAADLVFAVENPLTMCIWPWTTGETQMISRTMAIRELVGGYPSEHMSSSVGIMTFPTEWKNKIKWKNGKVS